MITPERVYEVFGIDKEEMNSIIFWCSRNYGKEESALIKYSPEMLVALVHTADMFSRTIISPSYRETESGKLVITAIESADSKNRKWPEILKALEE